MTIKFSTIDDMWINLKNTLLNSMKNLYHPNYQDQSLHIHGSPLTSEDPFTVKIRPEIKHGKPTIKKTVIDTES